MLAHLHIAPRFTSIGWRPSILRHPAVVTSLCDGISAPGQVAVPHGWRSLKQCHPVARDASVMSMSGRAAGGAPSSGAMQIIHVHTGETNHRQGKCFKTATSWYLVSKSAATWSKSLNFDSLIRFIWPSCLVIHALGFGRTIKWFCFFGKYGVLIYVLTFWTHCPIHVHKML